MKTIRTVLFLAALALPTFASTVFSFTSGNLGEGTIGNSITQTISGETLTATAWSNTGAGGTIQDAALGQYSGLGLGVCNQDEFADCDAPQHEVDDNSHDDFVLFSFSQAVTSVSVVITPVCFCYDNASYAVGTGNPNGKTVAQEGPFTTSNGAFDTTRTVTISGIDSTSVLFGASVLGEDNYFKIESVTATVASVPEPGTLALVGGALIGLGLLRRRS